MKPLRSLFSTCAVTLILASSLYSPAAALNGTVTNQTTGKPSAGDAVVLLQLTGNMPESARTKTDVKGRFTFDLAESGPHLIRVEHQKGSYFKQAPPGTQSVAIDVYDVAAKVEGITTEADVMRMEADNSGLKITENYFVKNQSSPPRTQFSDQAYEIYLPLDAKIEGSAAMAPNGMPVSSSPVPLADKGHYAFAFPVRPGETRFQLSYSVPYNGSYKFNARLAMAAENFAIMLPKSMKFTAASSSFQPVNDDVTAQTFLAKNVTPGQPLEFTVSGTGSMPREAQGTDAQAGGGSSSPDGPGQTMPAPGAASADKRPGGGLGVPVGGEDPLNKYRWWILGGLSVVLAVGAGFLLRKPTPLPVQASAIAPGRAAVSSAPLGSRPTATTPPAATAHSPMLAALKEELFTLETERMKGHISDEEYAKLKSALEVVLRRALARQES